MKIAQLLITYKVFPLLIFMLNYSAAFAREETNPKPVFKLVKGQGTEV